VHFNDTYLWRRRLSRLWRARVLAEKRGLAAGQDCFQAALATNDYTDQQARAQHDNEKAEQCTFADHRAVAAKAKSANSI
jgi:hypothetical protein